MALPSLNVKHTFHVHQNTILSCILFYVLTLVIEDLGSLVHYLILLLLTPFTCFLQKQYHKGHQNDQNTLGYFQIFPLLYILFFIIYKIIALGIIGIGQVNLKKTILEKKHGLKLTVPFFFA